MGRKSLASAGGGHTIREEGTDLTQRTGLNFIGAGLTATDDAGGDETEITLHAALEDLADVGIVPGDSRLLVGTGSGALAWETGATLRTSIGVAIGTDVQAFDAVLLDIADLAGVVGDNEVMIGTGAGTFAFESGATLRTSLGLVIGTDVQAEDAVLTDLAALSAVADNELIVGTGAGTYAHEAASTLPATIGGIIQDLDTLGAFAAKAQLLSASGAGVNALLSVGTNDQVLTAASGETTGLKWADAAGGGNVVPDPGGRLCLTSVTPVHVSDAADQTTLFYAFYKHDQVPMSNGSTFTNTTFTELSIAMAADTDWVADTNYDVYIADDGGTMRLCTGTAWTNATTRSAAISRLLGVYVNDVEQTARFSGTETFTMTAKEGLYVGTIRTTGTAGTTTMEFGGVAANGNPAFLYVWNMYNRVPVDLVVIDSTDTWTYTTPTLRSKNNSTGNRVTMVRGLDEDGVNAELVATIFNSEEAGVDLAVGIGLDSTSAISDLVMFDATHAAFEGVNLQATYANFPGLGLHFLQALEYSAASGTTVWNGDTGFPTLSQNGMTFHGMV